MLSTTPAPVNSGIWNATMPVNLANSIIATKRPQIAGCDIICSGSERDAIAEWLAQCPVSLVLRHDPVCQSSYFEAVASDKGGSE